MDQAREFFCAVMRNDLPRVKELVESGLDVTIWNEKVLSTKFLTSKKSKEVFRVYDYEKGRETPLHIAARHGYLEMARLLVANGADLEARDLRGNTPLHIASKYNQTALVEFFLMSGANVNAYDQGGWTALYHACSVQTATLLLDHGAAINGIGEDVKSPLHFLTLLANQEIALLLIERGADINQQDADGKTPLHQAVYGGNRRIIERLLVKGAGAGIQDNSGKTALDYAREKNIPELIELFHYYGVNE